MTLSKIEWTDRSDWNPVRGCTRVSPGCGGPGPHGGCYAEGIAARFSGPGQAFEGYAEMRNGVARWTGKVGLIEDRLLEPIRWRKPAKVFAASMSDLFHENLALENLIRVLGVIALCPHLTMQVLTKRSARLREIMNMPGIGGEVWTAADRIACEMYITEAHPSAEYLMGGRAKAPWPLPNLWLGVSTEDQARANERIPDLLQTPATVRFISAEPMLGPLIIRQYLVGQEEAGLVGNCIGWTPPLDLVIVGGESGPRAREFRLSWAKSIIEQCRGSDAVPFIKQLGANAWDDISYTGSTPAFKTLDRKGGDLSEWPTVLQVREMPEAA